MSNVRHDYNLDEATTRRISEVEEKQRKSRENPEVQRRIARAQDIREKQSARELTD